MDVFEITDFKTGISEAGVNYLQPADSFQNILNGYIYRQVLQSRKGVGFFAPQLAGGTRVFGIFEHTLPNSTKELLAFDRNFLYKFNTSTGVFDSIPFGGSMAGYAGFNITANDFYISGVSYPSSTNTPRFVFVGQGITPNANGSAIFFYDGTSVLDYTNTAIDNPNYKNPPQGTLTSGSYVLWFNERLNIIIPIIQGNEYNQGVLYSGIRTISGNGDSFIAPGSGLFQADTYQNITGCSILGQIIVLNFDRMNYTLEKTRDAFNPYFGRAIPGVLGTDAKFSAVSWYDQVDSMGKTGLLGSDGRQSLKIDNKIPRFTAEKIDQLLFNLTYGGFDRITNQFLWAYKASETEGNTQDRVLAYNYEEQSWAVYDQRFSVLGQTDLGLNKTWDEIDYFPPDGNESWATWETTEDLWDRIGLGKAVQKTLAGDDFGFIYEINQDYDDYITGITGITQGPTTTLITNPSGILKGDLISVSGVTGMTEINNFDPATNSLTKELYTVTATTLTSVTFEIDSTNFSPYISGGNVSKVISFSADTIPFNPYRSQGRRCFVSHVEFLIDSNNGDLKVDVFADQESLPFKQDVLLKPIIKDGSAQWVSMSVDQESNFLTFRLKQQSPSVQVRLTSMRLHCEAGGMTSG